MLAKLFLEEFRVVRLQRHRHVQRFLYPSAIWQLLTVPMISSWTKINRAMGEFKNNSGSAIEAAARWPAVPFSRSKAS